MEKLAILIHERVQDNSWKPIQISRKGPSISHLFSADDCLLFTKAKSTQVRLVTQILNDFGHALGLQVNLQKTKFYTSRNIHCTKINKFRNIYIFSPTIDIDKYLGFPILIGKIKKADFKFIFDKLHSRLAGWKMSLISKAGRVVLASSIMNTIPNYIMHNLWLPQSVCDDIDKCIRTFIWGGHHKHWANWEVVTKSKKDGGLGIRPTKDVNTALLGKHVWDLIGEKQNLWTKSLESKYLKGEFVLRMRDYQGSSYTLQSITKATKILEPGSIFRVGEGNLSI
uniref:Ribonuclease H protein At1g65750 family n=1 Tax=Cajanus cajan TaxID=3821 RepID=A0A151RLT0_CAJCA|nr:Putative ribonuclease H protein At1g65750 family [Cajanus cajan]